MPWFNLNRMEGTTVNDSGFQTTWEATRCDDGSCDGMTCEI